MIIIKNKRFFINILWCVAFATTLFGVYSLNIEYSEPPLEIPKQESATNFNEKALAIFSMGNKRMIASLLWVQTLLESDISHYKKKDLNSWMYLRFNSIINIDPYFYEAYLYGGQYLSVIKDDILGADKILQAGVKVYPEDFWLNYFLAFNAYYEMNDNKRAYEYYSRIINHPLTKLHLPYLPSIMARLKAEQGELNDAYFLLKTNYEKTKPGPLKDKYKQNLYALKAQIDLECLNKGSNESCNKKDGDGRPYQKNERGEYHAQKNWQIFKIYRKEKKNMSTKNKRGRQ